jgi:nitrite reductase (NADH) large subunit
MKKTHIILGSSAASMGVLSKLRTLDPSSRILCISSSTEMPYNTCLLADYVAGLRDEQSLYTRPLSFFEKNSIELKLNAEVTHVDAHQKKITLQSGEQFFYDTLFIGTGTSIVPLPISGLATCSSWGMFHTLEDSKKLVSHIKKSQCKQVVVIGAGLSGVECADALATHGIKVDIVEKKSHPLPYQIPLSGAPYTLERMKKQHVTFHGNIHVDKISATTVQLSNRIELPYDFIVIATGGFPNNQFLKNSGIVLHDNAIKVNQFLETSVPNIYAAGDVAAVPDLITKKAIRNHSWPDAMVQGMHAAHAMAGVPKLYPGFFSISGSRFFGTQFVSCGPISAPPPNSHLHERSDADSYQGFLFHENKLIGFVMIGILHDISHYKSLIVSQTPCSFSDLEESLNNPTLRQ